MQKINLLPERTYGQEKIAVPVIVCYFSSVLTIRENPKSAILTV